MKKIISDIRFQTYYLFLSGVLLFLCSFLVADHPTWLLFFMQLIGAACGSIACGAAIVRKELWTGTGYVKGTKALILGLVNAPIWIMGLYSAIQIFILVLKRG